MALIRVRPRAVGSANAVCFHIAVSKGTILCAKGDKLMGVHHCERSSTSERRLNDALPIALLVMRVKHRPNSAAYRHLQKAVLAGAV